MRGRGRVCGLTLLLAASALVGPAVAQPAGGNHDAAIAAVRELAKETDSLLRLGGFGNPANPRLQAAAGDILPAPPRDQLPALFRTADDAGAQALTRLGGNITPDVQQALGRLTDADRAAAAAGRPISVEPEVYVRAFDHLLHFDGGPPAQMRPPDTAAIASELRTVVAGGDVTPQEPGGAPTGGAATGGGSAGNSDDSIWPLVLVGLVVVAAAFGAVLLWAGRRRPAPAAVPAVPVVPPQPAATTGMQELLEVSRRLTSLAATGEIDRAVVREALSLVRGHGAALLQVGPDLTVAHESQPGLIVAEGLGDSSLRRVAETAQPLSQVSSTETSLHQLPAALAAVPLVGGGQVEAVLVLVRDAKEPFTTAERDLLVALAPMAAAARHNSRVSRAYLEESLVDGLTGVGNRRRLDDELVEALAAPTSPALVIVDLDHFKAVNDQHGHPAGDGLLRAVADVLRLGARPHDSVYRYGGEEFCLLLRGPSAGDASGIAERMRAAIAECTFPVADGVELRVTASFGVAVATDRDAMALIQRADAALYEAKRSGRNRVQVG